MLNLIGAEEIIKTIYCLSVDLVNGPVRSSADLKRAYQRMLRRVQPRIPEFFRDEVQLISDAQKISEFTAIFNTDSKLNDLAARVIDQEAWDKERTTKILSIVSDKLRASRELNPEFFAIFDLAVNGILYSPSSVAGGGSVSSAIGVIWVDPRDSWHTLDYYEFFVHESTHTMMFLDEHRFGHYYNIKDLEDKANYYVSAILSVPRPLDKVIHSIVVATEVLSHRFRKIGHDWETHLHPPSDRMISMVTTAIASILEDPRSPRLIKPRGLALVERCKNVMDEARSRGYDLRSHTISASA